MYIPPLLSKSKPFTSEKLALLVIFSLCIAVRAAPELVASPYPIGYDVINYYIPTISHFEDKWDTVSKQYPLYVTSLYLISVATGLSANFVVSAAIIIMTGLFGISIFYLGRNLLKLGINHSTFIAIFAIVQLAVLRTSWDFHRDIFALTIMMFVLSLLSKRSTTGWKHLALILVLTSLTVAADRMVGALFSVSLIVYAILTRRREVVVSGILAIGLFCGLTLSTQSVPDISTIASTEIPQNNTELREFYNPADLLIYFILINGLLVAAGAIGFLNMKNSLLLKIPLIVCLVGSFSWLLFPENRHLLADRWIILTGIFLSIFAGYGILHLVRNMKKSFTIAGLILGAYVVLGVSYAVIPDRSASALYEVMGLDSKNLPPLTMQFNSIDVEDNDELLSTIAWINKNTEKDAIIVGNGDLRGFMELYLQDNRLYRFSDDPQAFAATLLSRGQPIYLIEYNSMRLAKFDVKDFGVS